MTKKFDYSLDGLIEEASAQEPRTIPESHTMYSSREEIRSDAGAQWTETVGESYEIYEDVEISARKVNKKARLELTKIVARGFQFERVNDKEDKTKIARRYSEFERKEAAYALGYSSSNMAKFFCKTKIAISAALRVAAISAVILSFGGCAVSCKEYLHSQHHENEKLEYIDHRDGNPDYINRGYNWRTYEAPKTFFEERLGHHYGEKPKDDKK
jgi:hypothetical protein